MRKNRATVLTLMGILLISNVVLLTLLVATNMSSEGDVAIGKAAPRDATINLPALKGGAILVANQWPDACSFVDQEEIKAARPWRVLPPRPSGRLA